MIRYVKHNEIEKKKWDNCIDHCTNNLIYAYSWYLDIASPKWEALVEEDYKSVMPLTGNKKYGVHYLYPPYFAQQLGVFSQEKIDRKKVKDFLNAIPPHYKFLEVNLNTHNTFELPEFQVKKNINIELDLNPSYEALRKRFSGDAKRNIKKSEKHNISLRKNISPSEIIRIFRKNTGKKITNLTDKNYKVLLTLINKCIEKGCAEVWGAFTRNHKLCAGAIWFIKNNRAIYIFSATDTEAKKNGGTFFLINSFIQGYSGKNMIFDFEGSNIPGIAGFYRGFGPTELVYLQIKKNNFQNPVRWIYEKRNRLIHRKKYV